MKRILSIAALIVLASQVASQPQTPPAPKRSRR
jgi:hypothetical protein